MDKGAGAGQELDALRHCELDYLSQALLRGELGGVPCSEKTSFELQVADGGECCGGGDSGSSGIGNRGVLLRFGPYASLYVLFGLPCGRSFAAGLRDRWRRESDRSSDGDKNHRQSRKQSVLKSY